MSDVTTDSNVNPEIEDETDENETAAEEGLFPVSGRWFTIGTYLFLLIWMGYMVYEALGYSRRMDWLFPLILGVPAVILLVLKLAIIRYPGIAERALPDRSGDDEQLIDTGGGTSQRPKTEQEKFELYMVGWIIVLPFSMFILGMGWTLLLYPFAFTWFFTRDLRLSVLVTGVIIVFVWVLFIEILELVVFGGVLDLPSPLRALAALRGNL